MELVLNNFINSLVWTKSSDRLSATLSGQTSRPYSNIGIHLESNQVQYNIFGGSMENFTEYSIYSTEKRFFRETKITFLDTGQ